MNCAPLFFRDIAEGVLPEIPVSSDLTISNDLQPKFADEQAIDKIEIVFCSFALHLIETSFELFSVLWELSRKSRWLVVLAPHKKPEIKHKWGWTRWDFERWQPEEPPQQCDLLNDRVHCRVYRSTNM